jgi:electron transfer flavoprotein-quinone oxidoreductase
MAEEYDVIVVGAGFSGPVVAKKCADAGLKVLMVERGVEPGEKVMSGMAIPIYGWIFGPAMIRDGNLPIERPLSRMNTYIVKDVEKGDIDLYDARLPEPLSGVFTLAYTGHVKPICKWEAKKAVESGVDLRTSTVAVDVIKEDGRIRGIVTDGGEEIRSKIVMDCGGSQRLLAIKAGMAEKYSPETMSLGYAYDYKMKSKEDMDKICGFSKFIGMDVLWGWDENNIAPRLGYGDGVHIFHYRDSIHLMQDECLRYAEAGEPRIGPDGKVPNLRKLLDEHRINLTTKFPRWRDEIAPSVKELRGVIYDTMEINVGLNPKNRSMPFYTDGMLLVGDAAGCESTALCDGVPQAWISAEHAADVAIEAIRANDTSTKFLERYDERIRNDPILKWSTSHTDRYNLRRAQETHDEETLVEHATNIYGLGLCRSAATPFLKAVLNSIRKDPTVITKWIKMWMRNYYNWVHQRFG